MDLDEIDFSILDLYEYGGEHGVSPAQMYLKLSEAIRNAYLVMADLEDAMADDPYPMPSTATH